MPLEIREIGIHMRVGDCKTPALPGAAPDESRKAESRSEDEREAIVEDCVRRVLAALKTLQER